MVHGTSGPEMPSPLPLVSDYSTTRYKLRNLMADTWEMPCMVTKSIQIRRCWMVSTKKGGF